MRSPAATETVLVSSVKSPVAPAATDTVSAVSTPFFLIVNEEVPTVELVGSLICKSDNVPAVLNFTCLFASVDERDRDELPTLRYSTLFAVVLALPALVINKT